MFSIINKRARNINQEEGFAYEYHGTNYDVFVLLNDGQRIMLADDRVIVGNDAFQDDNDDSFMKNNYFILEFNHKLKIIRLLKRSTKFDELYMEELGKGAIEAVPEEYEEYYNELYAFVEQLKIEYGLEDYMNFIH